MKCQNPNAEPTRKQTWAVFCMTKTDIRNAGLTRGQVSIMLSELGDTGKTTIPIGDIPLVMSGGKATRKSTPSGSTSPSKWALDLFHKALQAGSTAMQELVDSKQVRPMVVQEHENMMDDDSPVKQQWVVAGGPCGFAWVNVSLKDPVSRKFINQLKKAGKAGDRGSDLHKSFDWQKDSYAGGYSWYCSEGGQSIAYKIAYAGAVSKVLGDAGVAAWAQSRMD